jgi:hypothetical protein
MKAFQHIYDRGLIAVAIVLSILGAVYASPSLLLVAATLALGLPLLPRDRNQKVVHARIRRRGISPER